MRHFFRKHQLFFLGVAPSLTVAIVLGGWLILDRYLDAQELTDKQLGNRIIQLTAITRDAIRENDLTTLRSIAGIALEEPGMESVRIYDKTRSLILEMGRAAGEEERITSFLDRQPVSIENNNRTFISAPVLPKTSTADLASDGGDNTPQGWLQIEYSNELLFQQRYQSVLTNLILLVVAILISAALSSSAMRRLNRELTQLVKSVTRIRKGSLGSKLDIQENSLLKELIQEINLMSSSLQQARDEMQNNINQATGDLRETLETIEIQNIELDLARKEALDASRIKSEFLANTSHEIRTPLNGILGFTNLLLKMDLEARQREYLKTIQQSSENLLSIINDILDFSKIEAGKLDLDTTDINLGNLCDETIYMVAPGAREKQLELVLNIDPATPLEVTGDPLRLKQIIANLLSNAIKFTEKGYVTLSLSGKMDQAGYLLLHIDVTDTGVGIPSSQLSNIFEAFSQATHVDRHHSGGTGLGLVITQKLIETMGGDISVSSAVDKGSTFSVSLRLPVSEHAQKKRPNELSHKKIATYPDNPVTSPAIKNIALCWGAIPLDKCSSQQPDLLILDLPAGVKRDTAQQYLNAAKQYTCPIIVLTPDPSLQPTSDEGDKLVVEKPVTAGRLLNAAQNLLSTTSSPPDISRTSLEMNRSLDILAVDDNSANLKLLSAILADLGVKATTASNYKEALNECNRKKFDLIFMDIQMPEKDGIETTRLIRRDSMKNKDTPVIAVTAHALKEEKKQMLDSGLNDHLVKPINESLLIDMINRWSQSALPIEYPAGNRSETGAIEDSPLRPVDLGSCLSLANQNPELASEMLSSLLNNLEDYQGEILTAWGKRDLVELREQVHRLHGACCYTGVPMLKQVTWDFESSLKNGESELIHNYLSLLEEQVLLLMQWKEEHDVAALFG